MGSIAKWVVVLGAAAVTPGHAAVDIQALGFLVGHCWRADIGEGRVDTHCYEWLYDDKFVRDRHVVNGAETPYEGETLYYVDAATGELSYLYLASNGAVEQGTAHVEDGALVFPSVVSTDTGAMELRTVIEPAHEDCYDNLTEQKKAHEWVTWWRARYCRIVGE